MGSLKAHSLVAMAALAAVASAQATPFAQPQRVSQPRRQRDPVQRMVTSASAEIQAWNAAVDAKKRARKGQ